MTGFVYPNEMDIQWGLLIVLYPLLTGLVAGAFIISAFYKVFGIASLKPIARFSLLTSLSFLLVAPLPLLIHLGRPERGFEIFFTPNFRSAMAGFGYIWLSYLILVLIETYLEFRRDFVEYASSTSGLKAILYSILTLGVTDISPEAVKTDENIGKGLAVIGIPMASLLHGYVGFIFGAIKANPWWSTPLMPVIFLLSAIVSGIALLIVLYIIFTKVRGTALDHRCIASLRGWLFGFLVIAVTLEGLEVVSMMYEAEESWEIIAQLITQKLAFSYLVVQLLLGSVLPAFVLGATLILNIKESLKTGLIFLSSLLVLTGVFAMRWNVVIGGQLFSKSLLGFLSYTPSFWGREGILVTAGLLTLPLLVLTIIHYVLPPWEKEKPGETALTRGI